MPNGSSDEREFRARTTTVLEFVTEDISEGKEERKELRLSIAALSREVSDLRSDVKNVKGKFSIMAALPGLIALAISGMVALKAFA